MQDMHDNYHESYALLDRTRPKKKAKTVQYTPVLFGDLLLDLDKKKRRASKTTKLKILMDSGTSGTIISGKHIPKARRKGMIKPNGIPEVVLSILFQNQKYIFVFQS